MQKVIEVCTRVEGHGNVNIILRSDNIIHVEFELNAFRGFESILASKKLIDIPRIVSRVCGLCHVSQTIASNKAIEQIYGIKPDSQSIILRKLLMGGELIKSHVMHYFFQAYPDLMKIFKKEDQALNPYDLINLDPNLTSHVYDLIKIGSELDKVIGGRYVHILTSLPGGVLFPSSSSNLKIIRKLLNRGLPHIEYLTQNFITNFGNESPPEEYALENPNYLGLVNDGVYDRYNGKIIIKNKTGDYKIFNPEEYPIYFNKEPDVFGVDFHHDKASDIITGPIARYNTISDYGNPKINDFLEQIQREWSKSLLFQDFLQIIECYKELSDCIRLVENNDLEEQQSLPRLKNIVNSEGFGIVEAPRGLLLHHYILNAQKKVEKVKLFIATEFNMPIINKVIQNYALKLYEKEDVQTIKKQVQVMIRAFDPCIACATH
jgi:coenzyme F420-reducing hydrogenase alpha subunit